MFQAEINTDGTADCGSCGGATFSVSKFIQFILLFVGSWYCPTKLRYFAEFNPLYKATKPVNQN